MTEDRILIC